METQRNTTALLTALHPGKGRSRTRHKWLHRLLLMLALAIASMALFPSAADASLGTKYVQIIALDDQCLEGQNNCPNGTGVGRTNTIYVQQSFVDGSWVFDTVEGAAADADEVWMNMNYQAGCRTGYRVHDGGIGNLGADGSGLHNTDVNETFPDEHWEDLALPDTKSVNKNFDFAVPVEGVLASLSPNPFTAAGMTATDELLVYAEQRIQDRVDAGLTELEARQETTEQINPADWHGEVVCKGVNFGSEYYEEQTTTIGIRIVFEGIDSEPVVGDGPQAGDLLGDASVHQAVMAVVPDATDGCLVHVNGTFVSNMATTVSYRIVNLMGQESRLYTVEIDQTLVAHVSHELELDEIEFAEPDDTLTDNGSGPGHNPDQLVPHGSDNMTDVLHFEGVTPNRFMSNEDGYSVPPCQPTSDTEEPTDDRELPESGGPVRTIRGQSQSRGPR